MSRPDVAWLVESHFPLSVPSGVPLAGYAARTGPAVGVLDELATATLLLTRGADRPGHRRCRRHRRRPDLADEVPDGKISAIGVSARRYAHTADRRGSRPASTLPTTRTASTSGCGHASWRRAAATLARAREELEPVRGHPRQRDY